jgi:hypothetical protein
MDLLLRVPHAPDAGETLYGRSIAYLPGGKGGNQAVSCARQGARVRMHGCVGADAHGRALSDALAQDGIDIAGVQIDAQQPTGVALVMVDDGAQNRIVVIPGANACVQVDEAALARALQGAAFLLVQFETPLAQVARALEVAVRGGLQGAAQPFAGGCHARNLLVVHRYAGGQRDRGADAERAFGPWPGRGGGRRRRASRQGSFARGGHAGRARRRGRRCAGLSPSSGASRRSGRHDGRRRHLPWRARGGAGRCAVVRRGGAAQHSRPPRCAWRDLARSLPSRTATRCWAALFLPNGPYFEKNSAAACRALPRDRLAWPRRHACDRRCRPAHPRRPSPHRPRADARRAAHRPTCCAPCWPRCRWNEACWPKKHWARAMPCQTGIRNSGSRWHRRRSRTRTSSA